MTNNERRPDRSDIRGNTRHEPQPELEGQPLTENGAHVIASPETSGEAGSASATPQPRRRATRKASGKSASKASSRAQQDRAASADEPVAAEPAPVRGENETPMPAPRAEQTERADLALDTDLVEQEALQAQGFTVDEAQRLIDISKRLETSAEARESEASLRRLRFTQWLIEHGILDEFSA